MNRFGWLLALPLTLTACTDTSPEEEAEQASAIVGSNITQGLVNAASVGSGLASGMETSTGGDSLNEDQVKQNLEGGVDGTGPQPVSLEDENCVSYAWVNLTVTITYDQCVSTVTSEVIDGSVTVAVQLSPLRFSLAFDQLTVGGDAVDGTLAVSTSGEGASVEIVIEADIDVVTAAASVGLDGVEIALQGTSALFNGTGSYSDANVSASFTVDSVLFDGECLPTAGTVSYSLFGIPVIDQFLTTTPVDGKIQRIVGSGAPTLVDAFAPCGSAP